MNPEKPLHPRIERLAEFYRNGPKVCPFMSPDITRFVLVPESYSDGDVGPPVLEWAKTKHPMALAYVWEKDPPSLQQERESAINLFGNLLKILRGDETGQQIDRRSLEAELAYAFSDDSPIHPFLSYHNEAFYAIAMSPRHTSRYSPCFSVVLTRMSEVKSVKKEVAERIRQESFRLFGREYDADAMFIMPEKGYKRKGTEKERYN